MIECSKIITRPICLCWKWGLGTRCPGCGCDWFYACVDGRTCHISSVRMNAEISTVSSTLIMEIGFWRYVFCLLGTGIHTERNTHRQVAVWVKVYCIQVN